MSIQGSFCETCFSRDRTLITLHDIPKRLLQELRIQNSVCWECRAHITNMVNFKIQVYEAQKRKCHAQNIMHLKTMSTLSIKVLDPISVGFVDPQTMGDQNMVKSEDEHPNFLDKIKEENTPEINIKQENDTEILEEMFEAELEQFYQPVIPALLDDRERDSIPLNDHTTERDSLSFDETSKRNYSNLKGNMKRKRKRKGEKLKHIESHVKRCVVVSKTVQKVNKRLKVSREITNVPNLNNKSKLTSKRQSNLNVSDTLVNEFGIDGDIENNLIKTFKIIKVDGSDSATVKTNDRKLIGIKIPQSHLSLSFLLSTPFVPPFSVSKEQSTDNDNIKNATYNILPCPKVITKSKQKTGSVSNLGAYSAGIPAKPRVPPPDVALAPPTAEPVTTRSGRKVRSKDILNL